MANRPLIACSGCGVGTASRCGRCDRCKPPKRIAKPKEKKPWQATRRADVRFYNTAEWRKLSKSFLAAHRQCERCGQPSKHADHIIDVADAPHLKLNPRNLRALCISCHSSKTAKRSWHGR